MPPRSPNILYLMTDQQRFDTIAALGNPHIYTPNLDRLVNRGITFTNAYSTCPVCMPARYTIRTGCEPPTTRVFNNRISPLAPGQPAAMEERCGPYLGRALRSQGYRTFGIGKFHSHPWDEDLGFELHLHSEELYGTPEQRSRDAYAGWIARQHPEFDYIEALMGERTEMYYMPQASLLPAELTVERWAADRAVEAIAQQDSRPYFGFVSFIGPHPPFAPPLPFNRLYDPDRMPNPIRGQFEVDHMDEYLPWMNYLIWAEDIHDPLARVLKARYYGEITYIDDCIGRILDAVEASGEADNTLICFFSDHGDHLGDHHAWQKESFFEASCHVPCLVSWPAQLPAGTRRDELVCLTDLFALAHRAARKGTGPIDARQGLDVLGMLAGEIAPRPSLVGMHEEPGTPHFKIMVRSPEWKYIYMANGGREQIFHLIDDPHELCNLIDSAPETASEMRRQAAEACNQPGACAALDSGELRAFPFRQRPLQRIYQFDRSRGVSGFPENPADILRSKE